MPLPKKTGANHYHAQLGFADKCRAIKGLVVSWSMARINDLWDGSMDKRKVRGLVPCCGQDELRYRNASLIHITSNNLLVFIC